MDLTSNSVYNDLKVTHFPLICNLSRIMRSLLVSILLVLLNFIVIFQQSEAGIGDEERQERLLPFLAVVSFPNAECTVMNAGMSVSGVCHTKKNCRSKGGVELGGTCAQGYGVCCSFTAACPARSNTGSTPSVTIRNNLTTITGGGGGCNFVIPKQPDVCQIRLDFVQFQLGEYKYGPYVDTPPADIESLSTLGSCIRDKLLISPTLNLPNGIVLCGSGMGQHLYLDYGDKEKITLSLTQLMTTMTGNFAIRITMIKCDSPLRAPQGCTQYYRPKNGRVESFNYPNMQLNSHKYSVCIDNSDGAEEIQWRPCLPYPTGQTTSFIVSGLSPPFPPGRGPEQCVMDYVLIPGSSSERYCGGNFTSVERSSVIPFSLWVNFDKAETPPELTPSSFIDPTTGCPLGFTCSLPANPCTIGLDPAVNGICFPPPGYAQLQDNYNIGFCLDYVLGST